MITLAAFITGLVVFLSIFPFVKWFLKVRQICQMIDKVPGPKKYPLIGTMYEFFNVPEEGKSNIYYEN